MKRLKNITILLCFLSLLAFISCSAEDKTGINNPPEDTEITDGETGGSGGTGSGSGSGSGSETGGSGTGGSGTGGDSGSGTGTGGSGEGGSGSGSGSGEGGSGEVTPPSEPEIVTIEIEAKDFPTDLLGYYAHSKTGYYDTQVYSMINEGVKTTVIQATFDNGTVDGARHNILIEKWKKTTKGGKIIKLEGERDKGHGCYTVTFDCESETKTISGTFKHTGIDWSFSGTNKVNNLKH